MTYRRAKTAARGLGGGHQSQRQQALATMPDGQPCARCEQRGIYHPMLRAAITRRPDGRWVSRMLDLDDFPGRAFGGPQTKRLSYRRCNRRAGQQLTTIILRARSAQRAAYTRW